MTGNQYLIVILVGTLAYFIINAFGLYVKNKEFSIQIERSKQLSEQLEKIHRENIKLIGVIKEKINDN